MLAAADKKHEIRQTRLSRMRPMDTGGYLNNKCLILI